MENYLLPILLSYYKEIMFLTGRAHVMDTVIDNYKEQMININDEYPFISASISSYRDITQFFPNENLYSPDFLYHLSKKELIQESIYLKNNQRVFTISQSYEVMESFLVNILTEYLSKNPDEFVTLGFFSEPVILPKVDIRKLVDKSKEINNSGIIKRIRKISKNFQAHENNNILKLNVSHWFEIVSMVRHLIVHNRKIVTDKFREFLEKNNANKYEEIFNNYFEIETIDDVSSIFINRNKISDIIITLNCFAHFIFKSLSIEANLSLEVPQYASRHL